MKRRKTTRKQERISRILLVVFCIIIIFLVFNLYSLTKVLDRREYYAKLVVGGENGFEINGTALKFGEITPGGSATKTITVENRFSKPVEISIGMKGDIARFLEVSENDFVLQTGEARNLTFTAAIPKSAEYGNYDGKVRIVTEK